jgi:hypothetical protein
MTTSETDVDCKVDDAAGRHSVHRFVGHFEVFCRKWRVTEEERVKLVRYLALMRYEKTIEELS